MQKNAYRLTLVIVEEEEVGDFQITNNRNTLS